MRAHVRDSQFREVDETHIPGLLQPHDCTAVQSSKDGPHGRKVVQYETFLCMSVSVS